MKEGGERVRRGGGLRQMEHQQRRGLGFVRIQVCCGGGRGGRGGRGGGRDGEKEGESFLFLYSFFHLYFLHPISLLFSFFFFFFFFREATFLPKK